VVVERVLHGVLDDRPKRVDPDARGPVAVDGVRLDARVGIALVCVSDGRRDDLVDRDGARVAVADEALDGAGLLAERGQRPARRSIASAIRTSSGSSRRLRRISP